MRVRLPYDVAIDRAGNVYVADQVNSTICKVTAEGIVTTLAAPRALVAQAPDHPSTPFRPGGRPRRQRLRRRPVNSTIRKVTPTGTRTTVAGTAGVSGILLGADPRFASPRNLAPGHSHWNRNDAGRHRGHA